MKNYDATLARAFKLPFPGILLVQHQWFEQQLVLGMSSENPGSPSTWQTLNFGVIVRENIVRGLSIKGQTTFGPNFDWNAIFTRHWVWNAESSPQKEYFRYATDGALRPGILILKVGIFCSLTQVYWEKDPVYRRIAHFVLNRGRVLIKSYSHPVSNTCNQFLINSPLRVLKDYLGLLTEKKKVRTI